MTEMKETDNTNVEKDTGQLETSCIASQSVKSYNHFKKSAGMFFKS